MAADLPVSLEEKIRPFRASAPSRPRAHRRCFRPATLVASLLLAAGTLATPASAQQPDTLTVIVPTAPVTEPVTEEGPELPDFNPPMSPGGAFLRAVLLPGWGHASIGAYNRGGFYFAAESGAVWMMLRSVQRVASAKDLRSLREQAVRDRLAAEGVHPDSLSLVTAALDADRPLGEARSLVNARQQQFQDWFALGIFLVFISGADAFVSAHLADFPEPITLEATPLLRGGASVGVSIPVGPRPR